MRRTEFAPGARPGCHRWSNCPPFRPASCHATPCTRVEIRPAKGAGAQGPAENVCKPAGSVVPTRGTTFATLVTELQTEVVAMKAHLSIAAVLSATLLGACSDGAAGPAGTGRVTFQIANGTGAAAAPTFTAGPDVITITKVQVVARKIRLERANGTCPAANPSAAPSASGPEGGEGAEVEHHDKECADVRLAPMLLDPPVDATAKAQFSVDLPEGTYQEVKMQIHKPTPSPSDTALLNAHPEFAGISIKVTGTFNGTPFTFTTPLTAELEVELPKPLEVVAGTPTAFTLQIDLSTWFSGEAGALLSPINPSQQTQSRIEQNIRRSFHAFKDHDHDNHPDND